MGLAESPKVPGSPSPSSAVDLPALDLGAPPTAPATRVTPETDDDDGRDVANGPSWLVMLLASYASAVTLGLVWVVWSGRSLTHPKVEPASTVAADTSSDPGLRAESSRRIATLPPIPSDRLTTLGRPIRIGQLEVLPLEVTTGRVTLVRVIKPVKVDKGAVAALKLRIRLRNQSPDAVFAPLDEAFLRERERGERDSFIDAGQGRRIEMFPLAVESEWAIQGQQFRELGPGEAFETTVVSAANARGAVSPEMTWRIRLRTGINKTDVLGVRFQASEIRAATW
jgi:hypothetical protein